MLCYGFLYVTSSRKPPAYGCIKRTDSHPTPRNLRGVWSEPAFLIKCEHLPETHFLSLHNLKTILYSSKYKVFNKCSLQCYVLTSWSAHTSVCSACVVSSYSSVGWNPLEYMYQCCVQQSCWMTFVFVLNVRYSVSPIKLNSMILIAEKPSWKQFLKDSSNEGIVMWFLPQNRMYVVVTYALRNLRIVFLT